MVVGGRGAPERALLDAAIKRSRDDAVMQGASPGQLDGFEQRQDDAFSIACREAFDLPGVTLHRQETLRLSGFDQARFEGRAQGWTAQRGGLSDEFAQWRIVQSLRQGAANFGIFQQGDETALALSLRTALRPAYAVAYVRDVERAPEPVARAGAAAARARPDPRPSSTRSRHASPGSATESICARPTSAQPRPPRRSCSGAATANGAAARSLQTCPQQGSPAATCWSHRTSSRR